jgi:SnoaL-like domain
LSESTATTSTAKVVDGYFAAWNQTDAGLRRELIASTWTDDACYVDPLFEASGTAALDRMVATVHERYPDHRFRLTAPVEAHHDRARWGWEFGVPGEPPVAVGIDFAVLGEDGRLREVTGFFERPAA